MAEILERKSREIGHPILVISDEPYRSWCTTASRCPTSPNSTRTQWSNTRSSVSGERIGYLAISRQVTDWEDVAAAATIAHRILGSVNAPSLMQRVIMRCVDATTDIQVYDRNRMLLYGSLKEYGFQCMKPEGAFYLFVKSPDEDESRFCQVCKEHRILVVPGSSFACPGYVRIAYCVSYEQIERSLPAFKEVEHAI